MPDPKQPNLSQEEWINELYEQLENQDNIVEFYLTLPNGESKKLEIVGIKEEWDDEENKELIKVELE